MDHLTFQREMLLELVDWSGRPFEFELFKANLTRQEVDAFFALLAEIGEQQKEQERYGLTSIEPLLVNFVGMLDARLHPKTILEACVRQKIELHITEPLYRQVRLLD